MTDLTGKVALITGSARGVGKAIALRYATLGANVVVNYSGDQANAENTVAEIQALGARAIAVKADVSKPADLDNLYAAGLNEFGQIDIAIANAGVEIVDTPVIDTTEEQFDRLFGINAKGAFFTLTKAARNVADNGRIIYIGSSTTSRSLAGVGLYGSSKMAPRYLVEVLALEVGNRGITVNSIIPTSLEGAGVYTNLAADDPYRQRVESIRPLGSRMGRPEDVADAAEYFASDLAAWISGQHLLISGGLQQ